MSRKLGPRVKPETDKELLKYYKHCQKILLTALVGVSNCITAADIGNEPSLVDLDNFLLGSRAAAFEAERLMTTP